MQGLISRLIVTGLIVFLGIQLTGLSCLDDWQIASPAGDLAVHNQVSSAAIGTDQSGDDGCPCHLAFMSMLSNAGEVSCPIHLIDPGAPATWALAHLSLPFHPPLVL